MIIFEVMKRFETRLLLVTCLLFLSLIGLPYGLQAGVMDGMLREDVIERWGRPTGSIRRGNQEFMHYDEGREVELYKGVVTRVTGAILSFDIAAESGGETGNVDHEIAPPQEPDPGEDIEGTTVHYPVDFDRETLEGVGPTLLIIVSCLMLLMIVSVWKVYSKAGEPGWASLIPIYNMIVMLRIAGKPAWWFLLYLVPVAQFVVSILVPMSLAKQFGKSGAFGFGLFLLPALFYPILAFGRAEYQTR